MTLLDTTPSPNGVDAAPPPVDTGHAPADREMTMLEHLQELRSRLVVSVLAILGGIIIAIIPIPTYGSLTYVLIKKLTDEANRAGVVVQVIQPGEGFFTFVEVALVIGAALAMPVIIYQVLAFVTPALYENEKKYLYFAVPGVTLSFLAGVLFCYFLLLPFAIRFLGGFASDVFRPQWTAENYLKFITTFLFWVGLIFELPIVMFFLTKSGIVSLERLIRFRKYAFVLAFVIGAIITPTPDPVNQTIVSLPIYLLFELGVILARFA